MCGIAGIVRFDGTPVDPEIMPSMLATLSHRGRDGAGVAYGSGGRLSKYAAAAVGHRRLAIIDLSEAAAQPMSTPDRLLCVSLNGEIYNYLELRDELHVRGYRFRTESDTEVILAAYAAWGRECVLRFNGMFAFALWDEQRGEMFCARDHLGIKPFYYVQTDRFVAFASESKALRRFHDNALDPDSVASYLLGAYVPGEWSIFSGVRKLLPGHHMTIAVGGQVTRTRYWRPTRYATAADTAQARDALGQTLQNAVARQLRSDVPVGALLSGGIDSGMVVALAARQGAALHTYSACYEGLGANELPAAAAVASRFGTKHHEMTITPCSVASRLDACMARLSEPLADSAVVPSYALAEMAAADGVKVLLSGTGGDEVFGGYDRYVGATVRRRLFNALPEVFRQTVARALPRSNKLAARLRNADLDLMFTTAGHFDLTSAFQGGRAAMEGFLQRVGDAFPARPAASVPSLYRQMAFDLQVYLPDEILLLFDQMSMTHTVEGRVPLIDVEVVEAALQFPASSHASAVGTKLLFRDLAADHLGDRAARLPKQGFGGPVSLWVRENLVRFREVVSEVDAIPGLEGLRDERRRLCDRGASRQSDAQALFSLYCLTQWYGSLG